MKRLRPELFGSLLFIGVTLIAFNANINTNLPNKWWVDYSYLTVFFGIVIGLFPIIWNHAYGDARKIIQNHKTRFLIRSILGMLLAFSITRTFGAETLWLTLFVGTYFWVTFDILYNLHSNKSWYYIGNTAWIDKLMKSLFGLALTPLVKLGVLIQSIHYFLITVSQ